MIRRILTSCLVVGLAFVMVGCASSKKKMAAIDDQAIVNVIKSECESESGPPGPFAFDVDSVDGTVTLYGSVPSEDVKQQILQIVRDVEGVQKVQSFLEIKSGA